MREKYGIQLSMPLQDFLETLVPKIQKKEKRINQLTWIAETTGSKEAAKLREEVATEKAFLLSDKDNFNKLITLENEPGKSPLLKRELNILIRMCTPCQVSVNIQKPILASETAVASIYSTFRPTLNGKPYSENEIRNILKDENHVQTRQQAWALSKEIGAELSPKILQLVRQRNQAAKELGYSNFFSMQLALDEVDESWLFNTFGKLEAQTEKAYLETLDKINHKLSNRFKVTKEKLGPWAWADPFCQEDPLDSQRLDEIVRDIDILPTAKSYYQKLHFEVENIIANSDNYERANKNQHAFCLHIDREGDIRTLNNIKPSFRWLEIVLHELGHAIYEKSYPPTLSWVLKAPPHMITTEAIALLMGRQIYRQDPLSALCPSTSQELVQLASESLKRRQLIFCRWVLLMTHFEKELYSNPEQDLHALWWELVERYQKIRSTGSPHQHDWAAKYHFGQAPVYY